MRPLALPALLPFVAACASASPLPPEAVGTAAGPPLVAAPASETASASAVAATPPPPTAPSPYFPVIVHGGPMLRVHLLKAGAIVINGYSATPIRVDDQGARLEPSLTTGLKGADQTPAYLITGALRK